MQISALSRSLLRLIFSLSSGSTALTRSRLARRLSVSTGELEPVVDELTRLGLLNPARLRLTLSGLAVAVACAEPKRRKGTPQALKMVTFQAKTALFSEREVPRAVA